MADSSEHLKERMDAMQLKIELDRQNERIKNVEAELRMHKNMLIEYDAQLREKNATTDNFIGKYNRLLEAKQENDSYLIQYKEENKELYNKVEELTKENLELKDKLKEAVDHLEYVETLQDDGESNEKTKKDENEMEDF